MIDQSHGGSKGDHEGGRLGCKEKPMLERASGQLSLGDIKETSVSHVRSSGKGIPGLLLQRRPRVRKSLCGSNIQSGQRTVSWGRGCVARPESQGGDWPLQRGRLWRSF